jgi:DNA-binding response OmpR family regulator
MIVDDTPANLNLLQDILRQEEYEVRAFPKGRLALMAANRIPPEIMLLDVNMPEMNGYEVCEQIKANPRLADIPILFVSALTSTEDKVRGFRAGGADYISKPFQVEEVLARVETHLRLRRAQQAERDLLEKTLSGAIGALLDLVQIASPLLAVRSQSVRDIVLTLAQKLNLAETWQTELAAMLCLTGCVVLPGELFERAYGGQDLSAEEEQMFRAHPESGAALVAHIPRLGDVAEIIRIQQKADGGPGLNELVRQSGRMLNLALELDRKLYQGLDCRTALSQMKAWGRFDRTMLDALENYSPPKADFETRQLLIRELRPGMVLDEELLTIKTNMPIFKEGVVFTKVWLERLGNFGKTHGVPERVRVRVPKLAGMAKLPKISLSLPDGDGKRL